MAKAKAELEKTVGKGKLVKESDMDKLPYLQAELESFRLHPVVPLLLPWRGEEDVEICGYVIPKGTQVQVNIRAIGRDPRVWDEPDVFKAERASNMSWIARGHEDAGYRIGLAQPLRAIPVRLRN
ncbi:hypothetical protein K1719_041394 [Acacia pycnantha]|nr:hypothetical protein K1719_041394 [Acacia pycnantha]